ncbi:MAG: hypothetical protein IJ523_00160 [Succinivibrionaceae bacterium]|nr:hypothetical protein [Succinivibrionaceae bacterium]
MTITSLLNNKNFKLKRMFVYGMILILIICALSTVNAIITGSYPENFLQLLLTAIALEYYCVNSLFCLKIHDSCKTGKIPYDWIGVLLCTATVIIALLRIWTDIKIVQEFAIPAVLLTVSYTIAILPVSLQIDNHKKLSKIFGTAHRIITPLFGAAVAVNFLFPSVYPYLQTVTWTLVLLELLVVAAIMILYSKPFTAELVLFETGTPNIYADRSGKMYQVISMESRTGGEASEIDPDETMHHEAFRETDRNFDADDGITVTESEPVVEEKPRES